MGDASKRRPEYVVMFMPLEGAFIAAINAEPRLWDIAFESGVIISSPTHLLGILKIIEQLWRGDRQRQNAVKIADEAGKLLDKFNGFLTDMERIDKGIEQARGAYDTAMNKLTSDHGGLIKKAESLKRLGVSTKRPLPDSFRLADADDVTETDLKEGA
jgi:DNA recombination protein RmuC